MGFLPARVSPRSPRPGPVDRTALSAIVGGKRKKSWEVPEEGDEQSNSPPHLAESFKDPLGVNRGTSALLGEHDVAPYQGEEPRVRRS